MSRRVISYNILCTVVPVMHLCISYLVIGVYSVRITCIRFSLVFVLLFSTVIQNLQITDFIKWLTGTGEVPPLGFPKKFSVTFVHGCLDGCRCRPTVSTCDTTVKFPVHINSEEIMKEMLFSAIRDSYGFGNL